MKIAQTSSRFRHWALSNQGQGHSKRNFSPFTTIQTVTSYISALALDRELTLSVRVQLILVNNIYEYRHA